MKCCVAATFALVAAALAAQTNFTVSTAGDADFATLDEAIVAANVWAKNQSWKQIATVEVAPGTYALSTNLQLQGMVVLQGAGRGQTILTGVPEYTNNTAFLWIQNAKNIIRDLTISNVVMKGGAPLRVQNWAVVENVDILDCVQLQARYAAGGIYCYAGTISNVLFRGCRNTERGSSAAYALRLQDGVATHCEVTGCSGGGSQNANEGAAPVLVTGGKLRNSRVHGNTALTDGNTGDDCCAGIAAIGTNAKIYNCIVSGNSSDSSKVIGGLYCRNASVWNCTVSGNMTPQDSKGIAGFRLVGGTIANSIFWGNGDETSIGQGVIEEGLFATNVVSTISSGGTMAVGPVYADPKFVDMANSDFHLRNTTSSAYAAGADVASLESTYATITADIDGVGRGTPPCIGALELTESQPGFDSAIRIASPVIPEGDTLKAEALVCGCDNPEILWKLDGEPVSAEQTLVRQVPLGTHSLELSVGDGSQTQVQNLNFEVKPRICYVDPNGANIPPYNTPENAAHQIEDAYAALCTIPECTSELHIAAGDYTLGLPLSLLTPVKVLGAGRNQTTIKGGGIVRIAHLQSPDASLSGCTLSNTGTLSGGNGAVICLSSGCVRDCRIADTTNSISGGAVYMNGGFLGDTIFERNAGGQMGNGVVLTVSGSGIASNLLIRGNASTYNGGFNAYFNGLVYVDDKATLTHSRIIGNGTADRYGLPVVTVSGNATLRNCLIADNIGRGFFRGRGNIAQTSGFFQGFGSPLTENCTIAFNRSSEDDVPTVCIQQGIVRNSIFFGNFREGTISNDYANVSTSVTFTNNLVDLTVAADKGGWQGNPCFKSVARQDYTLSSASPAIDKGMPLAWMDGSVDLLGKPRLRYRAPDLGCFEAFFEGLLFLLY
ncbi:MAG: hypothetical protein ACI4X9_06360 [Kiritimatiellia bacterium]